MTKTEIKRVAKVVAEEFLADKGVAELQGLTQDHIDSFIIPIMTEIEDVANSMIATKIRDAFADIPLDENDEWWSNQR